MEVLKRVPKFFIGLGSTGWTKFAAVRDSPKTLGISKVQKVVLSSVYLVTIIGGIIVVKDILTRNAIFSDLQIHFSGTFAAPSVILCPGKNEKYEYHFWYRTSWIQELGLSTDAVNIVAKAAKEGELEIEKTKVDLEAVVAIKSNASGMTPKEVWKYISSSQYNEFEKFAYAESDKCAPEWGCYDEIKGIRRLALDFECEYEQDAVTGYFNCSESKGIWLEDNSYCLFWNNSIRHFSVETEGQSSQWVKIWNYNRDVVERKGSRVWVGNLETTQIELREMGQDFIGYSFVPYYMENKVYNKSCQLRLEENCDKNIVVKGRNYWHFDFTALSLIADKVDRTNVNRVYNTFEMRISGQTRFYQVREGSVYNDFQSVEIVGNVFGFSVGFSVLAAIKMLLLFIQKKKLLVSLIQIISVLILLTSTAAMMFLDYTWFQDVRFRNKYDIIRETGVPYPNIQYWPRYLGILNITTLERYNVSWQLVMYLSVVASLHRQNFWIRPTTKSAKEFFLWHEKAPAELRYQWDFMLFHLQSVSKEVYETQMSKVEQEYNILAKKMKVDPADIWLMYTKILLQPCSVIAFCYINGRYERYCCQYFHHYKLGQGVLEFRNDGNQFIQTKPGKSYGFKIYTNPRTDAHRGDRMWFDSFFKRHIEDCKIRYNCSDAYPSSWAAHPLVYMRMNDMRTVVHNGADQAVEITEQSELDYKPLTGDVTRCTYGPTVGDNHREKLAYMIAELMMSICNCYPCHVPGLIDFIGNRNGSCCGPKETGRCLTRSEFTVSPLQTGQKVVCSYASSCDPWKMSKVLAAPEQFKESDKHVQLHLMTNCQEGCTDTLSIKGTELYKSYQNLQIQDKSHFKRPCRVTSATRSKSEPILRERDGNTSELALSFYFENINAISFEETDLQNPWELISLFCGGVGLFLGLSVIAVFELFTDFSLKAIQKKGKQFVGNFSSYSLQKFNIRFTKGPEPVEPTGGDDVVEVTAEEGEETTRHNPAEELQGNKYVNTIRMFALLAAVGVTGYFMYRFWLTNQEDPIRVDFFLSKDLEAPNLAICTEALGTEDLSKIPKNLQFRKCSGANKAEFNCSVIFAVVAKFGFECMMTNFQNQGEGFPAITVEVFSPNAVYVWAGGRIYDAYINPTTRADEGKMTVIKYSLTEVVNEPECGKGGDMIECPHCNEKSAKFCCISQNTMTYNFSEKNAGKYCRSSLYAVKLFGMNPIPDKNLEIHDGKTIRVIKIVPEKDTKIQLVRKLRYSRSQQIMYYTSYIDIFVGLNLDNIIYFLCGWLKSTFFSLSE